MDKLPEDLALPVTARDVLIIGYCFLVDRRLLSALRFVVKNWRRTLAKRKIIQHHRRVREEDIRSWFRDQPASKPMQRNYPAAAADVH